MKAHQIKTALCLVSFVLTMLSSRGSTISGYCHTEGNRIVDNHNQPVKLNGIAWYGFEGTGRVVEGLTNRSMESYLRQMSRAGYNLVRIPFSDDIFKPLPSGRKLPINYQMNRDLEGLSSLEVMDKLVEKAGPIGIKIILDRHRPDEKKQSEFWYTPEVTEALWIEHWQSLARRYRTNTSVIAVDLHNEPHGRSTWGSGNLTNDWRLAAERAGNAILSIQPDWLIVVQGVEHFGTNSYWWGGNLMGVAEFPVRLQVPHRVVYSPRDYGPVVYMQRWFTNAAFPNNLQPMWDKFWGYIHQQGLAPVMVGEFGARSVDPQRETDPTSRIEAVWQNKLVDYIRDNQMYWVYWCWNPTSPHTGGLLDKDWLRINEGKQKMLDRLIQR